MPTSPYTLDLHLAAGFNIHPHSAPQAVPSSLPPHTPSRIVPCHHPAMSTQTAKPLWFISFIGAIPYCNFLHQKPPGFDCIDMSRGRPCDTRKNVFYILCSGCGQDQLQESTAHPLKFVMVYVQLIQKYTVNVC